MPEPIWLLAALAAGFLLALLPAWLLLKTARENGRQQSRHERETELATLAERLASREQQLAHQRGELVEPGDHRESLLGRGVPTRSAPR